MPGSNPTRPFRHRLTVQTALRAWTRPPPTGAHRGCCPAPRHCTGGQNGPRRMNAPLIFRPDDSLKPGRGGKPSERAGWSGIPRFGGLCITHRKRSLSLSRPYAPGVRNASALIRKWHFIRGTDPRMARPDGHEPVPVRMGQTVRPSGRALGGSSAKQNGPRPRWLTNGNMRGTRPMPGHTRFDTATTGWRATAVPTP